MAFTFIDRWGIWNEITGLSGYWCHMDGALLHRCEIMDDPSEVVVMDEMGGTRECDLVNAHFGTSFKPSDFPGR